MLLTVPATNMTTCHLQQFLSHPETLVATNIDKHAVCGIQWQIGERAEVCFPKSTVQYQNERLPICTMLLDMCYDMCYDCMDALPY